MPDDYMGKPYRIGNLKQLLRKWLLPIMAAQELPNPVKDSNHGEDMIRRDNDSPKNLHDFRNAMSGAIGGVELALMHLDDPERFETYLKKVLKASQRATTIASDMR